MSNAVINPGQSLPRTLAEALDVIRTIHHELLSFRNPEFDLIATGREGEFDDRVKAVLAHSAPIIKSDAAHPAPDPLGADLSGLVATEIWRSKDRVGVALTKSPATNPTGERIAFAGACSVSQPAMPEWEREARKAGWVPPEPAWMAEARRRGWTPPRLNTPAPHPWGVMCGSSSCATHAGLTARV